MKRKNVLEYGVGGITNVKARGLISKYFEAWIWLSDEFPKFSLVSAETKLFKLMLELPAKKYWHYWTHFGICVDFIHDKEDKRYGVEFSVEFFSIRFTVELGNVNEFPTWMAREEFAPDIWLEDPGD